MTRNQFITMVESRQKAFRRFLVALCCGDSQLADDIAQEALIRAFLSIEKLHNPENFSTWLYRIGYNTFLNSRRSSHPTTDYIEIKSSIAEETADASFKYQALYTALDRLTPGERTTILLYYMENYSIKEIAEIENLSTDAIKQHLSRGRKHLRILLDNQR